MMRLDKIGLLVVLLLLVGCSTPHNLPEAPTPIPTLVPATLPAVVPEDAAPAENGEREPAADSGAGSMEAGAELFQAGGCGACHSVDGAAGVGPTMQGLYGSERPMADGSTVMADETYLHKAIVEPGAQLASGFSNVMPAAFGAGLSDQELADLIAYIKSMGSE